MSILYDSLEEDEVERSSEEDEKINGNSARRYPDSFVKEKEVELLQNVKMNEFEGDPYGFPEIKKNHFTGKGQTNVVDDSEILSQQGLQVNEDGSISKSPRLDFEQLPFVTREYQNMLFQKKLTYRSTKGKIHPGNGNRQENCGKGMAETSRVPGKSGRIRLRSLSCSNGRSSTKELMSENLTDAMKQKLLEKHLGNSPGKRPDDRLRKVRPIANYLREREKRILSSDDLFEKTKSFISAGSFTRLPVVSPKSSGLNRSNQRIGKFSEVRVFKNRSDVSLHRFKPQLSYLERRQKEIGFNPLYLRYDHEKNFSDTNRSNFGDSVAGELPSISSRALSTGKIADDEEEEAFYRSLIEKEKREQLGQRTTRSEAHLRTRKLIDLIGSNSSNERKESKNSKKSISGSRNNGKLTAIDLSSTDVDTDTSSTKKNYHYCSSNSNASVSKAELALKARAYGFIANARNVFRWKNQAVTASEKKSDKTGSKPNCRQHDSDTTVGNLPRVKMENPSKEKAGKKGPHFSNKRFSEGSLVTPVSDRRKPEFSLTRGDISDGETDFASEIFQKMRYCLNNDTAYHKKAGTRSEQTIRRIHTKN